MKKSIRLSIALCAIALAVSFGGISSEAKTKKKTKATATATTTTQPAISQEDLKKQVDSLYQQILAYQEQMRILYTTLRKEPDQNIANQERAQVAACAQQIINLEAQIKSLTGCDTSSSYNIPDGPVMSFPTVLHTSKGDLVPYGYVSSDNMDDVKEEEATFGRGYMNAEVLFASPVLGNEGKGFTVEIRSANGATHITYSPVIDSTYSNWYTYRQPIFILRTDSIILKAN